MRENPAQNRKLTDEQAVAIRVAYAGGCSSYKLATQYGLSQAGISSIVQGSVYKKAGGPITWPGQRKSVAKCRVCGVQILFSGRYRPRTCSSTCVRESIRRSKIKRPSDLTDARLQELYWGRNMTAPEIARLYDGAFSKDSVQLWLIAANIPRRRSNWRQLSSCAIEGCEKGIHKLWNGKLWYGRLCKEHLRERDTRRRHFYENQAFEQRGRELATVVARLLVGLPDSVRYDAEADIMVAVLSSELLPPLTRESVKPYIAKAFRENADAWKFISLAAPTREGDDAQTWGERLGLT